MSSDFLLFVFSITIKDENYLCKYFTEDRNNYNFIDIPEETYFVIYFMILINEIDSIRTFEENYYHVYYKLLGFILYFVLT